MSATTDKIGKLKNPIKEIYVEWETENFFSPKHQNYDTIFSPDFHFAHATWTIQLDNKLFTDDNSSWIGIYLVLDHNPKKEKMQIAYSLGIKCDKDLSVNSLSTVFEKEGKGFGRTKIIKRKELFQEREKLVPGDTLTVFCKASIASQKEDGISALSEDFKNLFINEKDYDATICVKDRLFHVHKVILGSRSPVLCAMFQHDMKENNSNTVNIDDCDPEIFQEFLLFLYSGKIENLAPNNVVRLYNLADKYIMKDLKQICLDFMKCNMNLDNIFDIVILADQQNEKSLKETASEWFKNNLKDIIRTNQWVTFLAENSLLAAELLKQAIPA